MDIPQLAYTVLKNQSTGSLGKSIPINREVLTLDDRQNDTGEVNWYQKKVNHAFLGINVNFKNNGWRLKVDWKMCSGYDNWWMVNYSMQKMLILGNLYKTQLMSLLVSSCSLSNILLFLNKTWCPVTSSHIF